MRRVVFAFLATSCLASPTASAAGPASLEGQNTFVKTHCAVCHNDRANNGGLSLEGFDAAVAPPSLAAMLLNKMTSGTALTTVHAASHDQAAAAALDKGMKNGAIGAAGIGVPDKNTQDGLIAAFAAQANGAAQWSITRTTLRATGADVVTASVMREVRSAPAAGRPLTEAEMYRLVITCNTATREGAMQLAWSPVPRRGTLSVAMDGKPAVDHVVDGTERMGNGTAATSGPAAFVFARFGGSGAAIELPKRSLTASGLFPGEMVTFPFDDLGTAGRQALSSCFR
jgi:hypothetical protein